MKNLPATVNLQGNALDVYNLCQQLESRAAPSKQMFARVLGYLVLYAPSLDGSVEMQKTIRSCQDDASLLELGNFFAVYFISTFKKFKGRTPIPSFHPSRSSLEEDREIIMQKLLEAPKDHRDAKEKARIRDGYRCVVTGNYDHLAETETDFDFSNETLRLVSTECAQIVPDSTYYNTTMFKKSHYAASMLTVLQSFGYDIDALNGPKVHSLFNVMTMDMNVHDLFDRLKIWFEATDVENCYRVRAVRAQYGMPQRVTFTTTDPNLPPD